VVIRFLFCRRQGCAQIDQMDADTVQGTATLAAFPQTNSAASTVRVLLSQYVRTTGKLHQCFFPFSFAFCYLIYILLAFPSISLLTVVFSFTSFIRAYFGMTQFNWQ
jgi:hypothetical protein